MTSDIILREVTNEFRVTLQTMKKDSQLKNIAEARIAFMYLLRHELSYTYEEIAEVLNRHYSTVIKCLQNERDQEYWDKIDRIKDRLQTWKIVYIENRALHHKILHQRGYVWMFYNNN